MYFLQIQAATFHSTDEALCAPTRDDCLLRHGIPALVPIRLPILDGSHFGGRFSVPPVNLAEVDHCVDVVRACGVCEHVDGQSVGGNVDFREDVKEIQLFHLACAAHGVEERFEGGEVGVEQLYDLAEGLVDAVVVDAGRVEADGRILEPGVGEIVHDALDDVVDGVVTVVGPERVDLVDEDRVADVGKALLHLQDGLGQTRDRLEVVVLRVEDPYHGAGGAEDVLGVEVGVGVVDLAGKIPDGERPIGAGRVSGNQLEDDMMQRTVVHVF